MDQRKQKDETPQTSEAPAAAVDEPIREPASTRQLKKPVDTLAMSPEEGGRISLLERKLYFTLMWFAQQQGWAVGQESFSAPLREVLKRAGYTSRNIGHLRDVLAAMVTTKVEWQSPTKTEESGWGVSGMIAHAAIEGGTLEWSYSPRIRPSILNPMPYARGSLEVQGQFKSYSALALYDICSRYLSSSTGLTPRRHWVWWRPVLTGGSDGLDTAPQFKWFNRDVLKKALFEVNLRSPIAVELITHKSGRAVTDIQFRARRKESYVPLADVKSEVGLKEIGRAIAAGVSQSQAELFLESHGEQMLSTGVDALVERQSNGALQPVASAEAYLGRILDNQPHDASTGALINLQKEAAIEKQQRLKLLEQFHAKKLAVAWELFLESNTQDKADLQKQFEAMFVMRAADSTKKLYERSGLESHAIRSHMKNFLADNFFGENWKKPSEQELFSFALTHSAPST